MSARIKAKKGRYGVDGLVPTIRITSPAAGYTIAGVGSPTATHDVTLSAVAFDDAGDVSSSIEWTNAIGGSPASIGTGKNIDVSLAVGVNVIVASITVGGDTSTASITITVT
jgi:hypothetical protein